MNKTICLITTFHDPEGKRSIEFLKKHAPLIKETFDFIKIGCPKTTSPIIFRFLKEKQIDFFKTIPGFGSKTRRLVLREGLKENADYYLSIDLDRLLFWLEKYPKELVKAINSIKNLSDNEFLSIGRTKKAWDSHPDYQKIPELKTNRAISKELGFSVDITNGCYSFPRKIGHLIDRKALGSKAGVSDVEWLMISKVYAKAKIHAIFVDGLAWETNLIFGKKRAANPQGVYTITREQLAEETIAMIEKVKKIFN